MEEKERCCATCIFAQLGFHLYDCTLKHIMVNATHCCPEWTKPMFYDEDSSLLDWADKNF